MYIKIGLEPKENEFYVYELINPITSKCFYVGKGKNSRYKNHFDKLETETNLHKNNTIKQIVNNGCNTITYIVFVSENEKECLDKEKELIKFYGRRDNNTGILTNLTDGGEGVSGYIPSKETRNIRSINSSGNKNPMYGKNHTEQTINIIKEKKLKRLESGEIIKHSEEWKLHLKINNAGGKATSKPIQQLDSEMNLIKEWPSASQAAKALNLGKGNICNAARKRQDWKVGGYYWRYT